MEHLKIEYLPIDALTPYDRNAKEHPQEQIDQIVESIRQFGMNDPIGVWGEENLIVEGHGRLLALQQMGVEEVPIVRLDHMTDEQRRDYAIRHNRTAELSAWDFGKLEEELAALEIEGHDFEGLKFDLGKEIDWASVDDISEKNYEKPESDKLRCPICGAIDEKIRFVKV